MTVLGEIYKTENSPLAWGMKPHIRGTVPHAVGDFRHIFLSA